MHSKRSHVANLLNQKSKDVLEEQKVYKNIPKRSSILIYDPKIFKKDSEIQNNSITDEDEYNKEIYNDAILSYNIFINDENVIVHSKSSFYSFEGKNKNIHILNNTKNNIHNQNTNLIPNKIIKEYQNSNTVEKDNIEFMKIVNNFNEVHKKIIVKNIDNFVRNDEKKYINNEKKNNALSKFSIKKRKNNLRNHLKSPSQPFNRKNNEGETTGKEDKNIIMTKDKKLDMNSITKNLFNKNQQYLTNINNKNNEIGKNNTFFKMEANKIIILEDNIGPNISRYNKYNNSNNKNYKRKMKDCMDRKSKSMIDEDINLNEKIEKKLDLRRNTPLIPQRIIKKKNLILEEEQKGKNKISSIKRIEIDINNKKRGNLFISHKQATDNNKNTNINEEAKDKDKDNNKRRKFIYSNINSRNKENNTSEYQKNNNSNNKNSSSIFIYNNTRKHNLNNNYNVSSIKPYNKKPIINISNSINKNERDNKNRSLINNHRKIGLNQHKESENIKIERPLFHSRQGSGQNIFTAQKNTNSTQSCINIKHINNLKKQSAYTECNEPKTKRQYNTRRNFKIKQGKIDLFQNDYNLDLKNKINNNQNNSNSMKHPISNVSSARNEEKSTYSKNDEISTERSIVTKFSLVNNKNEGEKTIINTSKSNNNYNMNSIDINNKYTKNSLNRIVNYALKNTTNSIGINNNTKDENKKIYIYEQNHQNNFGRKNHNYHVIRSTSQDNNVKLKNKNNGPLLLKIENKISRIVTSTSVDNLKGTRRNKDTGNIKTIT